MIVRKQEASSFRNGTHPIEHFDNTKQITVMRGQLLYRVLVFGYLQRRTYVTLSMASSVCGSVVLSIACRSCPLRMFTCSDLDRLTPNHHVRPHKLCEDEMKILTNRSTWPASVHLFRIDNC